MSENRKGRIIETKRQIKTNFQFHRISNGRILNNRKSKRPNYEKFRLLVRFSLLQFRTQLNRTNN